MLFVLFVGVHSIIIYLWTSILLDTLNQFLIFRDRQLMSELSRYYSLLFVLISELPQHNLLQNSLQIYHTYGLTTLWLLRERIVFSMLYVVLFQDDAATSFF